MTYGNPDASIVLIQMADDPDPEGMESELAQRRCQAPLYFTQDIQAVKAFAKMVVQ